MKKIIIKLFWQYVILFYFFAANSLALCKRQTCNWTSAGKICQVKKPRRKCLCEFVILRKTAHLFSLQRLFAYYADMPVRT